MGSIAKHLDAAWAFLASLELFSYLSGGIVVVGGERESE